MGFIKTTVLVALLAVVYRYLQQYLDKKPVKYGGVTAPGWEKVGAKFREQLETGTIPGGAFSVYHRGKEVVNIWGGYADVESSLPWRKDTLSIYCSTTKAVAAIATMMLVDRGLLELEAPVASYWPEFGQNDKQHITVIQLLSHRAGLTTLDEPYSFLQVQINPEEMGRRIAAQKPLWDDRSRFGYHAVTFGLLVDQLLRRVDPQHRDLATFFTEEVAEPFGLDFSIGLPLGENYRTARVYGPSLFSWDTLSAMFGPYRGMYYARFFDPSSLVNKIFSNNPELGDFLNLFNDPYMRQVPLASVMGYGTGSSIAKLLGILVTGGKWNGKQLLSDVGITSLTTPVVSGIDLVVFRNRSVGAGTDIRTSPAGSRMFGHAGMGGQWGYADTTHQLAWSFLTNHFSAWDNADKPSTVELVKVMYEVVGFIEEKTGA